MRLGFSHGKTTLILAGTQLFYIILAVIFKELSDKYILTGIIISSFVLSVVLDRLILKKLSSREDLEEEESNIQDM